MGYTLNNQRNKGLLLRAGRVLLGAVVLSGTLMVLDIYAYLGTSGSIYDREVEAAYEDSYREAYRMTYDTGYREEYDIAFYQGYIRGYTVNIAESDGNRSGSISEMRIPSYGELVAFLKMDTTDSNEYIEGVYSCFDYTADLNNNAEDAGIRAAYVSIRGQGWAHALVAFETRDLGLVFIEPQSDRLVTLAVGIPYPWKTAGAKNSPWEDFPVEEIRIIW